MKKRNLQIIISLFLIFAIFLFILGNLLKTRMKGELTEKNNESIVTSSLKPYSSISKDFIVQIPSEYNVG